LGVLFILFFSKRWLRTQKYEETDLWDIIVSKQLSIFGNVVIYAKVAQKQTMCVTSKNYECTCRCTETTSKL